MAWVPGSRSKFGNWTSVPSLYSWNIAECDAKPQSINQSINPDIGESWPFFVKLSDQTGEANPSNSLPKPADAHIYRRLFRKYTLYPKHRVYFGDFNRSLNETRKTDFDTLKHVSVRNRCVIEVVGGVWVLSFGFRIFCWNRGFCHRTGSDLLLFLS